MPQKERIEAGKSGGVQMPKFLVMEDEKIFPL
jgi:hypothetical protein